MLVVVTLRLLLGYAEKNFDNIIVLFMSGWFAGLIITSLVFKPKFERVDAIAFAPDLIPGRKE